MVATSVVGIIQARMSSQRLPGKVLLPLVGDMPLLEVLYVRLRPADVVWWIATTEREVDDPIVELGQRLGLPVFRGSEDNVLVRFSELLDLTNPSWFIRVTADNPFSSGALVQALVDEITSIPRQIDRIWAKHPESGYPLGFVPEVVRSSAIRRLASLPEIVGSHHAEHVTSAIDQFASHSVSVGNQMQKPEWRWTIDTEKDLHMARKAFGLFGPNWAQIEYSEMVEILTANPEIPAINQSERQAEHDAR